jgi:tripartite-type tricarboxylate transporter receptor subunit TctC
MPKRRELGRVLALASVALLPGTSRAQERGGYPNRPIRMVVGFPPGQSLDITSRAVAPRLGEALGQPVVVDNKPGATGIISHEAVRDAAPDGYTLLMGSGATLAINSGLYRNLPYQPLRDFTPIALVNTGPMYLVTGAATPVNSLAEMLAYVRARPDQLSYGSGGSGLTQHVAMEMLKKQAGLDMLHVPYRGSPPMVTDLIAGRVQFGFDTSTSILPHAEAGRVKLLGITSATRAPRTPEVPTIAEAGLPGFLALTWAGLVGPARLPGAIVERLNTAMNQALRVPELLAHFEASGSTVQGGTAEEFRAFMQAELARWGEAVAASGAQID